MSRQMLNQNFLKTQDSQMRYTSILPPSSSQLSKVIKNLQKMYQEQKEKRQQLEKKVEMVQLRNIQRQSQLVRIIKKLKEDNSIIAQQAPEISKLFNKIWECFDQFNKKTVQIIEQKYEDNYKSMDRRVNVILQHFKIQLTKSQRNSYKNIEGIQKQMKILCQTAIKIQDRNTQLLERIKNLQFQRKVLIQQKFMILQDLNLKKSKLNALSQQVKILRRLSSLKSPNSNQQKSQNIKKQVNQIKAQSNIGISRANEQRHPRLMKKSQSKMVDHLELKELIKNRSEAQPSALSTLDLFYKQHRNGSIKNDKQMVKIGSTISYTPRSCHNRSYTSQTNRNNKNSSLFITNNKKNKTNNNLQSYKISLRVSSVHNYDDDNNHVNPSLKKQDNKKAINTNKEGKNVQCPWCKNLVSIPQNQQEKTKQQHYLNTIQSLQKCIKRQKQRNINLGDVVTRISNKSQQVNQALQKIIKDIQDQSLASESIQPGQKLDSIIQSEKFFNMIKILQQRLSMLQKPSVSCGWGETWAEVMPDF